MPYLIPVIAAIVVIVVFTIKNRRDRETLIEQKIRSLWGLPKKDRFHFERIERYADVMMQKQNFHQLSRQTLEDIDFYDLFSFIDRTSSSVGQQYLFNKLLHPEKDLSSLRRLDETVKYLDGNVETREKLQTELLKVSHSGAYFICSLLDERNVYRPSWIKWLPFSSLLVLALLILGMQFPVLLVVLIVPLTLNIGMHYWSREKVHRFSRSFPHLSQLIHVAERMGRIDDRFRNDAVKASIQQLKPFQWKLGLVGSAGGAGGIKDELSMLAGYIGELLKGVLLLEVYISFSIIRELEKKRSNIETIFKYVGEIDTAISVASVRAGSLSTCLPEFVAGDKSLAAKGVYHPLLKNCVRNDLTVVGKSILITGSNMSGKSTFLRTLVTNSILAQTIYTCFAESFRTPILRQFSSIRLDDSMEKGTSYFFEEVSLMGALIKEAQSDESCLFILDEVFKGTNTLERVAAAKAILSFLNRKSNIVVVSTHDLELSSMLQEEYDLYHFAESLEDGELHFDHKLKKGPMRNGNAIKILALSDYPEEIIKEAMALARGGNQ